MLEWHELLLFLILALGAEILGTIGGFGSSMLFVPLAGMFLDYHSVLGITAVFHVSSNLSKIALFRSGFRKDLLIQVGIPSVLFVLVGALLTPYVASEKLELMLGIFLVGLSTWLLSGKFPVQAENRSVRLVSGAFSGLAAGLLGTGGAIRGLVLNALKIPMAVFIATSALIDLCIDTTRSIVYASQGYLHAHDVYLIPLLVGISFLGSWIGKRSLASISEARFSKLVLSLILLTGIWTLGRAVWAIYKF
jgi:hypothetical protein